MAGNRRDAAAPQSERTRPGGQAQMERPSTGQTATESNRAAFPRCCRAFFVLLIGLVAVAIAGQVFAQFRIFNRGRAVRVDQREQGVDGVFLPVDRQTAQALEQAKDLLAEGQVADAVIALDQILNRPEDFFFKPDPNQTVHRSVKAEAQRLIGTLTDEQRETYELQFGTAAQQLLNEATQTGRMERLSEVVRRYFHTKAGYEAALVLAKDHLDHGRPLAAALLVERLRSSPAAAEQYEPQLSVLLATCWLRAGMTDKAKATLAAAGQSFGNRRLQLAGQRIDLRSDADQNIAALRAALGQMQTTTPIEADQWSMPKGDAARNAAMAGGSPLLNVRWSTQILYNRTLKEEIARQQKQFSDAGRPIIPALQPLAVGNLVLMRTPQALYGIDFETGKLVWPWPPRLANDEPLNASRDVAYLHMLTERMWENNTYGAMSSDGELVFMVQDLDLQQAMRGIAPARNQRQIFLPNGQMMAGAATSSFNSLSAHSMRREGALAWYVGGMESEMEPELAGAFFLGPPLPLQGQLYVLAEIKGGISLVVLDAKTGKRLWTQQLAMVEQNVQQDPFRRMTGATPSYADGVLICPTGAGAVVALDLATRSLLWGYQYPRTTEQERMLQQRANMGWNWNGNMAMPVNPGAHWTDSCATIADGRVYITAIESDQLHCLNLFDGQKIWEKPRENGLYIGAVIDDRLILVCEDQVQALKSADGKQVWSAPLSSNRPSGRGFYSGEHYYLSLSSAEVLKIDLQDGTIKARTRSRTGTIPGNLICYQGYVVSQGIESVDKYFQLDPLRKRVDETLAKNPSDPEALAWRGEIALDDGDLKQAVADLRKAYESTPPESASGEYASRLEAERFRTRELLFDALTALLKQDFAANRDSLAELERLIENPREQASYLRVFAAGLQSEGKTLAALEAYLKLAEMKLGDEPLEMVDASLSVRRDRWICARLESLWKSASAAERQKIDEVVRKQFASAERSAGDRVEGLRQFIASFGFHPAADDARERLAISLSGNETMLEREALLRALEKSADRERAGRAVARLAGLYESANRVPEAVIYYQRLGTDFAGVKCLDDKTGKEIVESMPPDYKIRQAMQYAGGWPVGRVKEEKQARGGGRNQGYQQYFDIELRGDLGPFCGGRRVQFDQSMQQIVGRDELGRETFRAMLNETGQFRQYGYGSYGNYAVVGGHLLVLNTLYQVLAIDTLAPQEGNRRRVVWHQNLVDPLQVQMQQTMGLGGINTTQETNVWGQTRTVVTVTGNQPGGTVSNVIDGGVAIVRGRELMFLDAVSGKQLWVRHGVPAGSQVYGDAEVLIVAPPAEGEAIVLRTKDGELLGRRKIVPANYRWATYGRNLLTWKDKFGGKLQPVLVDLWEETETDLGTYSSRSKATIVDGDSVAIYDSSGRFVILSLADGGKLLEAKVEPERSLESIIVQRSQQQYLLLTSRARLAKSRSDFDYQAIPDPNGTQSNLLSGLVYAFDRPTGQPQWQVPALVDMHGYVRGQGSELPVLVFLRHASRKANQQVSASMLCLDKRTGRAVFQDENLPGQAHSFEAVADPEAKTVSLQLPSQTVLLKYTDAPAPPEPTYQAGLEPPKETGLAATRFGKIFNALGRAAQQVREHGEGEPTEAAEQAADAPAPSPSDAQPAEAKPAEKPAEERR